MLVVCPVLAAPPSRKGIRFWMMPVMEVEPWKLQCKQLIWSQNGTQVEKVPTEAHAAC